MTIPVGVEIPVNAEQPAETDAEYIKRNLKELRADLYDIQGRLDGHAAGINTIGENMQWLVDNVKGIFQMLASPNFVNMMMQQMGAVSGGQPGPEQAEPGPSSGTDA